MEVPQISQDDLQDVKELSENIENDIYDHLDGHGMNIAMSALIGGCINAMTSQCESLDEIIFFRDVFIETYDLCVRRMQINKQTEPPFSS